MLQQAQQKVKARGLTNIKFEQVDADQQQLQQSQFDAILCSSAIVYLTDIPALLCRWHNALKPKGVIAFSCLAETCSIKRVQSATLRYFACLFPASTGASERLTLHRLTSRAVLVISF